MISWFASFFVSETEMKVKMLHPARNYPKLIISTCNNKDEEAASLHKQINQQLKLLKKTNVAPRKTKFETKHPVLKQLLQEIKRVN